MEFLSRRALDRFIAWMPILLLASLAALTWWLDAQVQDDGPRRDGDARHDPDLFAQDVRGVELDAEGRPVQTLAASRARHYPDDGTIEFDDPRFLMSQPGRPAFRVQADRARVSGDRERAWFEGRVKASRDAEAGPDGEAGPIALETEYLEVIPKRERALTDRPVTITDPRGTIRATGLVLDHEARTAQLKSEVRGSFPAPGR
jgi:lipopolysaccharide export system protein LptC